MRELIEQYNCDKCEKTFSPKAGASFSIPLERYTDAAGAGETRSLDFDLCQSCQEKVLRCFLKDLEWKSESIIIIRGLVKNVRKVA